jgi:hypothetical protein
VHGIAVDRLDCAAFWHYEIPVKEAKICTPSAYAIGAGRKEQSRLTGKTNNPDHVFLMNFVRSLPPRWNQLSAPQISRKRK